MFNYEWAERIRVYTKWKKGNKLKEEGKNFIDQQTALNFFANKSHIP